MVSQLSDCRDFTQAQAAHCECLPHHKVHALTHTDTILTHSLTHSLTYTDTITTHTRSHSLTHTHTSLLTHSHSLTLTPSPPTLTHTDTIATHTHSLTHTDTIAHSWKIEARRTKVVSDFYKKFNEEKVRDWTQRGSLTE